MDYGKMWQLLTIGINRVYRSSFTIIGIFSVIYKDTGYIGLKPTLMTSFSLDYLGKGYLQLWSRSEVLGIKIKT